MTDYTIPTLEFHLRLNTSMHEILFEQMEAESEFILSCLENMQIVTEAEVQDKKSKQGIFQRIINFIKKLFTSFADKAKLIEQANRKWMDENLAKLDNINFDGLEIEMVPFWIMNSAGSKRGREEGTKIANSLGSAMKKGKYKDMDLLKKDYLSNYMKEGDFTAGIKNYLRYGSANGDKPVKLVGRDLKKKVLGEMRPYCDKYKNEAAEAIKGMSEAINKIASAVDKEVDRRELKPTSESFCMIEGMPYNKTELIYCENFIVMEADEGKKEDTTGKLVDNTSNKEVEERKAATDVGIRDHGSKQAAKLVGNAEKANDDVLIATKNALQIMQTIAAAQMTVAEEAYHAYLSAIKQIVSARGPKSSSEENK